MATTLTGLDGALRGGVGLGQVTEFVGAPGVGKTQLCVMLAVQVALAGHHVVYIDTEHAFTPERYSIKICH